MASFNKKYECKVIIRDNTRGTGVETTLFQPTLRRGIYGSSESTLCRRR